MHSTSNTNRRQLLKWRPIHGVMIALALIAPLVLTAWLGEAEALYRVKHFPLGLLLLMLVMAFLCWNLNAARLRLMLGGRAGRLGQRGALGIELASKFALCATPGGSGGPATLLLLLARRGFPPAKGAAVFREHAVAKPVSPTLACTAPFALSACTQGDARAAAHDASCDDAVDHRPLADALQLALFGGTGSRRPCRLDVDLLDSNAGDGREST